MYPDPDTSTSPAGQPAATSQPEAPGPAEPSGQPEEPGSAEAADGADPAERGRAGEAGAARADASGKKEKKPGSLFKELGILVVVALVLSVVLQTFIARVYLIPSQSMEPTLHGCAGCTGDRIVVDKLTYRFTDPKPGDVVVFRGPESWDREFTTNRSSNTLVRGLQDIGSFVGIVAPDENDLVKRIIATGGQTVQCLPGDDGVKVDGKLLNEPYRMSPPSPLPGADSPCEGRNFGPITVPDGNVWVMGDNRTDSADSRYHIGDEQQGTVPVDNIIGKVRWIILPLSRMGSVASIDPQS